MKIKIEDPWFNHKCNECGKLIYPKKVYKVRAEKGKVTKLAEWRFCEKCFNELFSEKVRRK